MSPERVSVSEEEKGHSMQIDRRQKRQQQQQNVRNLMISGKYHYTVNFIHSQLLEQKHLRQARHDVFNNVCA